MMINQAIHMLYASSGEQPQGTDNPDDSIKFEDLDDLDLDSLSPAPVETKDETDWDDFELDDGDISEPPSSAPNNVVAPELTPETNPIRPVSATQPKIRQNQVVFSLPKSDPGPVKVNLSRPQAPDGSITKFFQDPTSFKTVDHAEKAIDTTNVIQSSGSSSGGKIYTPPPPNFDLSSQSTHDDPPTHHILNFIELKKFVYPVNKPIRDYQRNIIRKALIRNLICALPTGLGKTFIASVVMWNFYRWTVNAKIVFMAPTRPLVSQQIESFIEITGISINDTCVLLQDIVKKPQRADQWKKKRVFFATPQTVENDLVNNLVDPRDIVCVVLDEAHRATGNHSYVNVVKLISETNDSFRILALTATPSGHFEGVQNVIDNLHISGTEIRSEQSLDVRKYTHLKNVNKVVTKFSEHQNELLGLAASSIRELLKPLQQSKIVPNMNPADIHFFQLIEGMRRYRASMGHNPNKGLMYKNNAIVQTILPVVYAMSLLKTHGIYPFYERVMGIQTKFEGTASPGKTITELVMNPEFSRMISRSKELIFDGNERRTDFYGHPKLEHLVDILSKFFLEYGADSRAIVFAEFRESAAEILWVLSQHCGDIVEGRLFVGQASKGPNMKGMSQKEQQAMLKCFKEGEINVLVATSVAEEGLDIGEVDLIICYDQSTSPIRSIQRMGRTGRKREGHVYMLMNEKEEEKLNHALTGHKWVQNRIQKNELVGGKQLQYVSSRRILPNDATPHYEEVTVVMPQENVEAMESGDLIKALKPAKEPAKRKSKVKSASSSKKLKVSSTLSQFGFQTAGELLQECEPRESQTLELTVLSEANEPTEPSEPIQSIDSCEIDEAIILTDSD